MTFLEFIAVERTTVALQPIEMNLRFSTPGQVRKQHIHQALISTEIGDMFLLHNILIAGDVLSLSPSLSLSSV